MYTESAQLRASFVGGLRWVGGNATRPLIRLRLDDAGMHIAPSIPFLGPVLPHWSFEWRLVLRAERVRALRFASRGVRFYIEGHQYPFTFWYPRPENVLAALARRGIPTDNNEHRIGLMGT
jgi:hypothetical protein